MTEYLLLFASTVLVNNFVLSRFLGLCIFFGVSKSFDASVGMGVALTAVMTIVGIINYLIYHLILVPLGVEFFTTLVFVLVVASVVQLLEVITRRYLPNLYQLWGVYLILIATNCVVLAVPLLNAANHYTFMKSIIHSIGAGAGFALALILMSSIREKLARADVPKAFQGLGIAFVTAGLLALAFLGFSGMIPME
ncbi:MAG: RnfABCDGE type electron transport complex subunit A [Myxococcales bacterium]|nr:MAG: RnfABCDGE type electron transport complex subunit A [Myxococcales bacterium]